jgi:prepilin-type N-terminal cleavage/methylation domain-containing protein
MKTNAGFTLLEVLVALAILGVGIIAAMQLFPMSLRQSRMAAERTAAANLANSELSRLRGLDVGGNFESWLSRNTLQPLTSIQQTYALYNGWYTSIQRMGGDTDTYRVTFSVQMMDGRREIFVTYVTRR